MATSDNHRINAGDRRSSVMARGTSTPATYSKLVSAETVIVIARPVVLHRTVEYPAKKDVRKIIRALVESRDFLSYQLSNASGLISDSELDARTDEVFAKLGLETDDELLPRICILFDALREDLDTDVTAAALGCDLEQAERLLTRLAKMVAERRLSLPVLAKELTP